MIEMFKSCGLLGKKKDKDYTINDSDRIKTNDGK